MFGRGGREIILSSRIRLASLQCSWRDSLLDIIAPPQFDRVRVRAPGITRVLLNGVPSSFTRIGNDVVVTQNNRFTITLQSPRDTMIFLGRRNSVRIAVCNPTGQSVTDKVTIQLGVDWRQRMHSQLSWWGGIVNLMAINKGSVERTVFPSTYAENAAWIDRRTSETKTIPSGGIAVYSLTIDVPNDAAGHLSCVLLFGGDPPGDLRGPGACARPCDDAGRKTEQLGGVHQRTSNT
jgi:hypothetical protein